MSGATLVIGSRGSQLALWQAEWVRGELGRHGFTAEIRVIKTTGDRVTGVPLAKIGGKGLFTKEIEDALLAGSVDLAVHSLKDLPTMLPSGLALAAVPKRADPRDVLVCSRSAGYAKLADLPQGARVGTSSLRREAQLLHLRADLLVEPIRGNLDTRLRKAESGALGAVVLAAAGLHRLGFEQRVSQYFEPDVLCPAPGQGALGIEARAGDARILEALALVDDPAARRETAAERALLSALGGGCQAPIGALARAQDDGSLSLMGVVASRDGQRLFRASGEGADPADLGARVAAQLLGDGAREILEEIYGRTWPAAETP